jgi:hypothetical protein
MKFILLYSCPTYASCGARSVYFNDRLVAWVRAEEVEAEDAETARGMARPLIDEGGDRCSRAHS